MMKIMQIIKKSKLIFKLKQIQIKLTYSKYEQLQMPNHYFINKNQLIMSFQRIRKMVETRRDSPLIFEGIQAFGHNISSRNKYHQIKPIDQKAQLFQRGKKSTFESSPSKSRGSRNSLTKGQDHKNQRISPLIGNFLHILPEGLKKTHQRDFSDQISTKNNSLKKNQNIQEMIQKPKKSDYSMIFPIGKGGFGKVWKVKEKKTTRILALKQMQKVKIVSKRSVHSVTNQRKLLATLKSEFLVNMHRAFQDKEHLYLVLDYCNRGDMRYHLAMNETFSEKETKFFLGCVILCLQYMHRRGVIHRDLKPENLVIDSKGYVRVTDLGVSRHVQPNNASDTSGTPGYMAPEVITRSNHSYPVDYFALGVMGYEFMTGKRPYVGANRKQIRQKILAKQVQLLDIPHGWSKQAVDFVNQLIERKPANRLGYNGIKEIKEHPWFDGFDWERLFNKKIAPPYLPPTIEENYGSYQQCISEDTQIADIEEYRLVLRHPDTQQAFIGYDHDLNGSTILSRKNEKSSLAQNFMSTTMREKRSSLHS